ncbi:tumor necrosis factor receptor superfamily member 8 [Camelus ferus]|nr:tumor necrosis factor receptor superfamily member 8 [Camelus ferus]
MPVVVFKIREEDDFNFRCGPAPACPCSCDQGRAPGDDCCDDKAAGKCCDRCPEGVSPKQRCPQGSSKCWKQCESDYYLDQNCRCTACVSCAGGDLVEKKPCSWNSSRVCECRAGMFCETLVINSCARCFPHSVCPAGMVVKVQGLSLQQPCPQGSVNCRKPCEPNYYLDRDGRCTACVSCSGDDLVEKIPCTWNSSRVCECRPGMFCVTSATNSCARCVARPICPPGMVAKLQGMAEGDTTYELPPPGTYPDCSSNPEDSGAPASTDPSLISLVDSLTGKPTLVSGPVLFWVTLTLVVVISSGSFLLCHWKACRKWIRQKLHLCYSVQTFQPKLEPAGLSTTQCPPWSPVVNSDLTPVSPGPVESFAVAWLLLGPPDTAHEACFGFDEFHKQQLIRSISVAEPGTEELGLLSPQAAEMCPTVGAAGLESLRLLEASPASSPSSPTDLPEPRGTTECTNNRIENIYIMKADTVIVGTVKTEVPEGQGLVGPAGSEFEEGLEVDYAPHYPEQETEPPLGSCGDVMFSVEEEGKEDPLPTTDSGK